jgi:NADH:ubiquinone oxidoreductase subunit 6 (subunit J)
MLRREKRARDEGRGKMAAVESTGELILLMTACVGALCDGWDMIMMMVVVVVVMMIIVIIITIIIMTKKEKEKENELMILTCLLHVIQLVRS